MIHSQQRTDQAADIDMPRAVLADTAGCPPVSSPTRPEPWPYHSSETAARPPVSIITIGALTRRT